MVLTGHTLKKIAREIHQHKEIALLSVSDLYVYGESRNTVTSQKVRRKNTKNWHHTLVTKS